MLALRSPDQTNSADKPAKNVRSPNTKDSTRAITVAHTPATDDGGDSDRSGDGDEITPPLSDFVRRRGATTTVKPYGRRISVVQIAQKPTHA